MHPVTRGGLVLGLLVCASGGALYHALAGSETGPTGAEPTQTTTPSRAPSRTGARLGINLAPPADWGTEFPFVDLVRTARDWVSQRQGSPWGKGPTLARDAHGWVTRLETNCWAESPLSSIPGAHLPQGNYTVLWDGEGLLDFRGAEVVSRGTNTMIVRPNPRVDGFTLKLMATNPKNYVKNIRVILPGFAKTYKTEPWRPGFLNCWRGLACLRFMHFMATTDSKIAKWSERPTVQDMTWATKGVPLEMLIDLSNRLKADPWFCMPHLADDDYIHNFAKMCKEKLDPSLLAYVEYSNELWNSEYEQTKYVGQMGKEKGFHEKEFSAGLRYTAYRSVQIFKIWEKVYGGKKGIVRVLPAQSANIYTAEQVAGFQNAYQHADVLAIAPYVSCNIWPKGGEPTRPKADEVVTWGPDRLLEKMEQEFLPEAINKMQANKKIAEKYRLRLVAYEGGQHMTGRGMAANNTKLLKLLMDCNAHPRMGKIYRAYYKGWEAAGGELFCHFNSISMWSKYGCWGLMQFSDDDPANSPKFMATMQWARERRQPVRLPGG